MKHVGRPLVIAVFLILILILITSSASAYSEEPMEPNLVAEVIGGRSISGMDTVQFVISNLGLDLGAERHHCGYADAYNVTIWLEGNKSIKVITNKTFFERIPQSSVFEISFLVLAKPNVSGRENLILHMEYYKLNFLNSNQNLGQNLTQNSTHSNQSLAQNLNQTLNQNLTFNFTFEKVEKQASFMFKIVPLSSPKIKAIIKKERFYASEINNLRIYLINEGGLARNVTAKLASQNLSVFPDFAIISALPSAATVPVTFQIKKETRNAVVSLNLSYEYFNGTEWIVGKEQQNLLLKFENRKDEILSIPDKLEVERGEKGDVSFYVFNPYEYPITLSLELKSDSGITFKQKRIFLRLIPGETKLLPLDFEVDDKAKFERIGVKIDGSITILSPYPKDERFSRILWVEIKPEPEFEVRAVNPIFSGKENQILEISIKNTGETAENIRIILKPAIGIPLKLHDTFIEKLGKGEEKIVKFRVDVGDLPPQNYAMEALMFYKDLQGEELKKDIVFSVNVLAGSSEFGIENEHAEILGILVVILILAFVARRK